MLKKLTIKEIQQVFQLVAVSAGLISSLGCRPFESEIKLRDQQAPSAAGASVGSQPKKPGAIEILSSAGVPKKSRPTVKSEELMDEGKLEASLYGVDPVSVLESKVESGLQADLEAAQKRREERESSEQEKARTEETRKLQLRQEKVSEVKKKYENLSARIEDLNRDLIAAKVAEVNQHDPLTWPLEGLKIKVFEKDTFELFEIPGSEELRKGDRNNSLVVLNVDNKENMFVMFDNKVTVDSEAARIMSFRGYGAACLYRMQGYVTKGDELVYAGSNFNEAFSDKLSKQQAWKQGRMVQLTLAFKGSENKSLEIHCHIKTNRLSESVVGYRFSDFLDNFTDILLFKVNGADWTQPSKFFDRPQEGNNQVKSFEIVDLERLKIVDHTHVDPKVDPGLMLMEGIIVETSSAENLVIQGFAKHSCRMQKAEGELKVGQRFKYTEIVPIEENALRNYATYEILYTSEDGAAKVGLSCLSRKAGGVPPEIIEVTFKNVLKFGVLPVEE